MIQPRTFTKTIYLDNLFSRNTTDNQNHWAGTTVKAFRVLETNNENFQLDIVADPVNGSIQGIPLGKVRCHNYTTIANSACFENKIVQSGVWVKVLISVEDELIFTDVKAGGSSVAINYGSGFDNNSYPVTNAAGVLLPANDQRASAVIYNTTDETFYIGTNARVSDANFATICVPVLPYNGSNAFVWDLADALYCRKANVGTINPIIVTKNKAS